MSINFSNIVKKIKIKSLITLCLILLPIFAVVFRWDIKTIKYKEEVKLSDGSMIWVDIKRHYIPTTSALGDGGEFKLKYKPTTAEISWDTGFDRAERKQVLFSGGVILIDRIDNAWYVVGGKPSFNGANHNNSKAINCRDVGVHLKRNACLYILQNNGQTSLSLDNAEEFISNIKVNVLDLTGLYDWTSNKINLDKSHLTWSNKLMLERTMKNRHSQSLDKPFSEY
ncbi:MAG: hypothetical protein Q4G13_03255 [Moraxella sp.]|nr:hypothetical protein [Moraxella sp.]